ncbi:MAG: anaerobic ribonucleoside-triphosphate reductase [Deltaproteobacteria bacterium]|nr:anaerobic ribonucleoside-triphosphate reductase [Deltaproteobacteria bacterium]
MGDYRDTTDLAIFVRNSLDDVTEWQRRRIVDALVVETGLQEAIAEEIAREVEKQLISAAVHPLTSSLIRELVDAKLVERGLLQARKRHARIGFPLYDVRNIITFGNKGNANVPLSPEGTNLLLAEGIKRDFALAEVFSDEVVEAHIAGDIHLHGLGYIDRFYSARLSLEHILRKGLNLPQSTVVASPAKHAETLVLHLVRFSVAMQGVLGGHIAWTALNTYFAPYLVSLTKKEVKQVAQMLVYEISQLASGRGGQSIFCDIHLNWRVPPQMRFRRAILPGGREQDKLYGDYEKEAQGFFLAIFAILKEGDALGKPFSFPCPIVATDEEFLFGEDAAVKGARELVSDVASAMGNPIFSFIRNGGVAVETELVGQNVSLNLPRVALMNTLGDKKDMLFLLDERVRIAVAAHRQKLKFLQELLNKGKNSPLSLLPLKATDGNPSPAEAIFSVGFVGLAEIVRSYTGQELHQSAQALSFGREVLQFLRKSVSAHGEKNGIKVLLAQSHAETTAHRFAKLDLRMFSPTSGRLVRGNIVDGGVYYTNSNYPPVGAELSPLKRAKIEGELQHRDDLEATTQIHLGAGFIATDAVNGFLQEVFTTTACRQLLLSPEAVFCRDCGQLLSPSAAQCGQCASKETDTMARITRYYGLLSAWNKGKRAEFVQRKRHNDYFLSRSEKE